MALKVNSKFLKENTSVNTSNKLKVNPKFTTSQATINPVVSTLKNASVIQTANDVKQPTLTYKQAEQIAKENNIKIPNKLTLPNFKTSTRTPILASEDLQKARELEAKQEKSNKGIFKTPDIMQDNLRRFEDGYQFGDVTKSIAENAIEGAATVGGTIADVGLNIGKGILTVPENMAKAGASGVAGLADLFGNEEWANQIRRNVATKNIYTDPTQKLIDKADKVSIAGDFTDDIASGIGQVGAYVATSRVLGSAGNIPLGKLSIPTTAILSGAGAGASEAYRKADESVELENMTGKEKAQIATKIVGSGLIEGLSEGLFGLFGVGGMEATDMLAKSLVKKANTTLGKVATKMAVSGLGESAEELISYAGNWALDNGLINNMGEVDYSQKWDGKQVVREMLTAFLTSAITQGGTSSVQLSNAVKTELANKEQELGRPLTNEERTQEIRKIADSILADSETMEPPPQNNTNLEETSPNTVQLEQNNVQNALDLQKTVQNVPQIQEETVETNIGNIPIAEYRDIMAQQAGFNDYADMRRQGYKLGNKYDMEVQEAQVDRRPTLDLRKIAQNYIEEGNISEQDKQILRETIDSATDAEIDGDLLHGLRNTIKEQEKFLNTAQNNNVEIALTRAMSNKDSKGKTILGKINDFAKNKIQQLLGKDVSNRQHVLNDNDIRHMLKEHGNPEVESRKGQIAVTEEDIKKIPDILENPTDIVIGTKNKDGDAIRYVKKYEDNNTFVVEVVPDKGNNLIIKTMWKKPIALADNLIPASTSETQGNLGNSTSNINNIIPTSQNYVNKNIPTQAEQQQAQQELRNKLPTEETRLNMKKPKLEDIAELTQEQAELPSMSYKQRADKNTPYRRKFWDNVESSKIISKDVKEQVNMTNYERKHNADVLEKMKERLDAEPMKVAQEWFRKDIKKATDQDVALGAILMERYQAEGRFDEAVDVVEKLADMGTEAGRTVQMYSIFQRLTPEGMMIYQQRKLNSALETLTQKQTGKWVEQNKDKFKLTEDNATFITAKVQEAQNAPTERQKQIALAEIETRINDKLPPEAGQSVKAFRRIAMLFNPKTQVRNIAGNITVMPLNYVTDLVATGIDKAIAKKTGVRTTALPNVKTIGKGFKKGAGETIDDYRRGIRTTPTGSRYEIQNNAKSFNENTNSKVKNAINKKMNAIDRILSTTLELGDRPFYEAAYQNALEGQMKANGVTEPTQEMIDIASNVALSQTWQDNNNYTQAVLGIRSAFNKININGFGLGDLIIPFAKTPANLTKAMVDYSPAGFIPAIINYNDMRKAISRGDMTAMQQKKFVTSVGKAMAGTILYAIAGALVKGDKITGSSDEDKDVANFEKNVLGIQPYSIKIGDKTFTYNWANPIATPFAIMADTYKMSEEGAKWNEILVNAFKVAGDQLVANSFLQGIQELLSSEYGNESAMDNLVGAIMDLPTQFTPTLFGQFATQFDSTKRQTFENGDTVGTMINEVKNKLPGARNTLAPQVNTFGEEIQNYGGDNNPFNVFLNPGNISSTNATETQKELYKLYQDTKDKTIFPTQAPYSVSGGGEKVTLSSQDRADYQKTSGQFVTENLDALFNSEYYKSLDNDKKAEVVSEIVADANILAKGEYLETKTSKELKEKLSKLGDIPYVEYYNAWSATRGIESDKNWKGESISGSKKKKQIQAINNATSKNLTNKQRETLYGLLNVSGY